jgi:hypothetical protein
MKPKNIKSFYYALLLLSFAANVFLLILYLNHKGSCTKKLEHHASLHIESYYKYNQLLTRHNHFISDVNFIIDEYNKGNYMTPSNFYNIPSLYLSANFYLLKEFNLVAPYKLFAFSGEHEHEDKIKTMNDLLFLLNIHTTQNKNLENAIANGWKKYSSNEAISTGLLYHDGFFAFVDEQPMFDTINFRQYVNNQILKHQNEYPLNLEEEIMLYIDINKYGDISDVHLSRKTGIFKDSLIEKIILNSPRTTPAKVDGRAVNFRMFTAFYL